MAFPGGRLAHPESQNEEENEKNLRKSKKIYQNLRKSMRKEELLPTQDCEAGYGPDYFIGVSAVLVITVHSSVD